MDPPHKTTFPSTWHPLNDLKIEEKQQSDSNGIIKQVLCPPLAIIWSK